MSENAGTESVTPPQEGEQETFSREYVENLRKENATYRTKAKEQSEAAKTAEKARLAAMDEADRVVAEAEARGKAAATGEFGQRLARSEFLAAAARRNSEYDAGLVLDDLNLARYVSEDGEPDVKAIGAAVERLIPVTTPVPSFDGGARTAPSKGFDGNNWLRQNAGK